jgi:hypothetical protein
VSWAAILYEVRLTRPLAEEIIQGKTEALDGEKMEPFGHRAKSGEIMTSGES